MVFSRILKLFLMNFPHHLPKADEIPVCSGGTPSGPRQIEHSEGTGLSTDSPTVPSWFCKTHHPTLPAPLGQGLYDRSQNLPASSRLTQAIPAMQPILPPFSSGRPRLGDPVWATPSGRPRLGGPVDLQAKRPRLTPPAFGTSAAQTFALKKKFKEKLQVMESISSPNPIGGPALRWSGTPMVRHSGGPALRWSGTPVVRHSGGPLVSPPD